MESLKKQAAKLLGEQKKYKRWLAVFLCLAVVVTAGTVAALKMNGQALSHKQKVLECKLEVHEHTEECYKADPKTGEKKLVCGLADYVVHVHNDDCYGADGELACQLPEVENHVHEDSCYQEKEVLICGKEENPGHVHTEECRALICGKEAAETAEPETEAAARTHHHTDACKTLICGKEETPGHQHTEACRTMSQGELKCESIEEGHEHTAECYEQIETITCGQEETEAHVHDDTCYDFSGCGLDETTGDIHAGEGNAAANEGHIHTDKCYNPYACGIEEGAEGHVHTEACYQTNRVAVCGKLELHTHVKPEEAGEGEKSCYDAEGNLVCGIPELKEHVHGEDCFVTVELTKEEVEAMQGSNSAASEESGSTNDGTEDDENHEDSATGELITKVYEDGVIRIVAEYDETANIPEGTELFAEQTISGDTADLAEDESGEETAPDDEDNNAAEGSSLAEEVGSDAEESGGEVSEAVAENDEVTDGTDMDGISEESESGLIEKVETDNVTNSVTEEVSYNVSFRLEGEGVRPEADVMFTAYFLGEEGAVIGEPTTAVYLAGEESLTIMLTRTVTVEENIEQKGVLSKIFEDDKIRVVAEYKATANIPENAELVVEQITDEDYFAAREAELQEHLDTEDAVMEMLLNIGFYVDGEEIEPEDMVSITIQFLDSESIAVGDPIDVVHFAKDKTEVLSGSVVDENGATSFETDSFSDFGLTTMLLAAANEDAEPFAVIRRAAARQEKGIFVKEGDVWEKRGNFDPQFIDQPGMSGYIDGSYYISIDVFDTYGSYGSILPDYNRDKLVQTNIDGTVEATDAKWIAYSTNSEEPISITTAKLERVPLLINGADYGITITAWVFEGINAETLNSITGLYYLKDNSTEYKDISLNDLGNSHSVIFDPGNGSIPGLRVSVSVVVDDSGETVSVRLPGNGDFGNEFAFTETVSKRINKPGNRPDRRLVGWYNIEDHTYYDVEEGAVTAAIDPTKENVFYADWVSDNYNFHSGFGKAAIELTEKELATKNFVTTRVIDYNELFNIYSLNKMSSSSAGEVWEDSGVFHPYRWDNSAAVRTLNIPDSETSADGLPKSMLFVKADGGSFLLPKREEWNTSLENFQDGLGNEEVIRYLFPSGDSNNNALGVHFVGYGDYLYRYDSSTGYYEYDSNKNAVSYEADAGQFYLYNDKENLRLGGTKHPSFLPFNEYKEDHGAADGYDVNYHFGMYSEVQFYLPAVPGSVTDQNGKTVSNQIMGEDGKLHDMIFSFSGDDDVWVFVDDRLVLDMGGIHGALDGRINFSEGKAYKRHVNGNMVGSIQEDITDIGAGAHTLKIYYMERGAGLSNCKISFNIVPQYMIETPTADTVTVEKNWVKPDYATRPDKVTVQLYQDGEPYGNPVTLDEIGHWKHTWSGLETGKTYTVEEEAVDGYKTTYELQPGQNYKYLADADSLKDTSKEHDENIVVILNQDNGHPKALFANQDGLNLNGEEVNIVNGVISLENLSPNLQWEVKEKGNGYALKNLGNGLYLTLDDKGIGLSGTCGADQIFNLSRDADKRLVNSDGDQAARKVAYKDGQFSGESITVNNAETSVRVFRYHTVSSVVRNYTITNTYLPTIRIQKVDSDNPETSLAGAEFRLSRAIEEIQTDKSTVKKYSYYTEDGWQDVDSKEDLEKGDALKAKIVIDKAGLSLANSQNAVYTLTEVTAPTDYLLPEGGAEKIEFTVSGGKISEVKCMDIVSAEADGGEANPVKIAEVLGKSNGLVLIVRNKKEAVAAVDTSFIKYSTATRNEEPPTPLSGAVFDMYKEDKEGTYLIQNGEIITADEGSASGDTIRVSLVSGSHMSDKSGVFYRDEKLSGTYYLKENKAPDGYNQLTGLAKITVNPDGTVTAQVYTQGSNWKDSQMVKAEQDSVTKKYEIKVFNIPGYELPETGSMGTKTFTIGGAMLILSAAAILMYGYSVRRKKSERRLKK